MVRRLLKRGALFGTAVVGLQAAYAVLRPSPEQAEFDPSGVFGAEDQPGLRVAVLGDSSVTAPGLAGPHESWISLVCDRMASRYHVVLRSFAVGGSKAADLIVDQMNEAIDFDPDLIFVSVGANDVIKAVPRHQFERNLDRLIAGLTASGATVIQSGVGELGTIPRLFPPLSHMMNRRSRRFDAAHWRVAERYGSIVVDQRSDDRNVWYQDRELWSADLFHVSAKGHARWAETVWRTVEPILDGANGRG